MKPEELLKQLSWYTPPAEDDPLKFDEARARESLQDLIAAFEFDQVLQARKDQQRQALSWLRGSK